MMNKISILLLATILVGLISCHQKKNQEITKPNVLIIFPDQLRRYSAGYWSKAPYRDHVIGVPDPVVTPAIDKLAKNGIVFTNAISNFPLCSPYRGMMLTGQYPEQNGIWNNCKRGRSDKLKDDIKTITDYFYEAGYNTAYIGKCHWEKTEALFDESGNYQGTTEPPGGHLVNAYDTYVPPGPARHNIEYFYQALKDAHYDSRVYSNDPMVIDGKTDGELHRPQIFSAKNEAAVIIKYLQNTHDQRNMAQPFCMIWSLNPPHNPWDDENTDMEMLRTYYDTDNFAQIDELVLRENADLKVANYARNYFANVSSVDKYIGLVLDELEKQGILDNTIVVFTSDHGEMLGSHKKTGKNVIETESIAIPFIVHYPEQLKPGISIAIFGATDVLPTLLGLANLSHKISNKTQGMNFAEELQNPEKEILEGEAALLMLHNQRGLYTKDYTLGVVKDAENSKISEIYFYNNLIDPYQKTKIREEAHPDIVNELLVTLGKKLKEAGDPWYKQRLYDDFIVYPD